MDSVVLMGLAARIARGSSGAGKLKRRIPSAKAAVQMDHMLYDPSGPQPQSASYWMTVDPPCKYQWNKHLPMSSEVKRNDDSP